jgi:hypothetical protein
MVLTVEKHCNVQAVCRFHDRLVVGSYEKLN